MLNLFVPLPGCIGPANCLELYMKASSTGCRSHLLSTCWTRIGAVTRLHKEVLLLCLRLSASSAQAAEHSLDWPFVLSLHLWPADTCFLAQTSEAEICFEPACT